MWRKIVGVGNGGTRALTAIAVYPYRSDIRFASLGHVYTRYSQLIRTTNPQSDKRHPMTDARLSFSTATH